MEALQKNAGKDASHIFNSTPHSLASLQMMDMYMVGYYSHPELDLPQIPVDYLNVCATLLDTERHLGYLFGLHAYHLHQSLPMQPAEVVSKNWLYAPFLVGGLQVTTMNPKSHEFAHFTHFPFNDCKC